MSDAVYDPVRLWEITVQVTQATVDLSRELHQKVGTKLGEGGPMQTYQAGYEAALSDIRMKIMGAGLEQAQEQRRQRFLAEMERHRLIVEMEKHRSPHAAPEHPSPDDPKPLSSATR